MNKKTDGLGNNAKREDALNRIGNLEKAFQQLVPALEKSFKKAQEDNNEMSGAIDNLDRVLTALIEVVGKRLGGSDEPSLLDQVKEVVKNNRIKEIESEAAQSDANLKVAVAEGKLIAAEAVKNENDILVTTQTNDKGEVLHPTRAFLTLGQFNPGVKELLVDKKCGDVITLPTGGSVTILEIYNIVNQAETAKTE